MKRKSLILMACTMAALICVIACSDQMTFKNVESPPIPVVREASAKLLWIGPDYKVVVTATFEDPEGITKLQLKNGEWQLNDTRDIGNEPLLTLNDTFLVTRDINPTAHAMDLTVTNSLGGILKATVDVEDLSGENQIEGYSPDILPPVITVTKPTITKFYGMDATPVDVDVEFSVTDEEIASVEVKIWGETAQGESVAVEDVIYPSADDEKKNFNYIRTFTLPAGKVGEYQYIVRSTDSKGNKTVKGNTITVGYMDRLYLSDAENADEVANQGFDHMGACRGLGTLVSMRKQGANTFVANCYYRNDGSDNIRFVAFIGTDRPFIKIGSTNQAKVNYTIDGPNVIAPNAGDQSRLTTDLSSANFKLPVSSKGYYKLTVDMTTRTVTAEPFTPLIPVDAVKYPGWSESSPWAYLAVTGTTVVGTAAWTETATSPKLSKETNHPYLYTGTFQTNGSSSNMSLNAPLTALGGDIWGKGWIRLKAARASMLDDYNDLVTNIAPVGPSSGGANWGFSVSPAGTYKATYDLALQRFRVVRTGN